MRVDTRSPFRKVMRERTYQATNSGTGYSRDGVYRCTRILTLDCGHEIYRKGSIAVPTRARCYYCQLTQEGN